MTERGIIATLEAENARLREALEPFANFASGFDWARASERGSIPGTETIATTWDKKLTLTLGDCRRARAALKPQEPDANG